MKEKGVSSIFATLFLLVLVAGAVVMFFRGPSKPEKKFENQFNEGNIPQAIETFNTEIAGTEGEDECITVFMDYIDRAYNGWENGDSSAGSAVHRLKLAQTVDNDDVYSYAQEKLEKIYAVHGEDITYTEEEAKEEFFNEFKKIFTD